MPATSTPPKCDFSHIYIQDLSFNIKEGKVVSWIKSKEAITVVESKNVNINMEGFGDGLMSVIINRRGILWDYWNSC